MEVTMTRSTTSRRPKLDWLGIRRGTLTSRREVKAGDFVTFVNSYGREIRAKVSWVKGGTISALVEDGHSPAYTEMTSRKTVTKIERFSTEVKDYGWTLWE